MRDAGEFLRRQPLTVLALFGIGLGVLFWLGGNTAALAVTAFFVLGTVIAFTVVDMVRQFMAGHWGLDVLAVIAMVATLSVGEYLAGLIIAVMLTGGEALEAWAERRAGRELDGLVSRAPVFGQLFDPATGSTTQVPVADIGVGDLLLVRSAEVVPVDGELVSERASLDESSVTGEPIPATLRTGAAVLSGTANAGEPFTMRASRLAADSQYASIVRLVENAVSSRAPLVRLADRYAVPFTIVSLTIAGLAWYLSGDPVRFAEVLVVATPCPLLIAAPIAFMGGMSSAARTKVVIKDAGTIETLARVRSVAFDKTGTLTAGRPEVVEVRAGSRNPTEVLALAAAVEQWSIHVFAQPVIARAQADGVVLPEVRSAREFATNGVEAELADGSVVRVGKPAWVKEVVADLERVELTGGKAAVYVSVDDTLAGVLLLADPVRPGAAAMVERLRAAGVEKLVMVSGDVAETAAAVADQVGLDTVHAEVGPAEKVDVVGRLRPGPVLMVGDGINDAPVLAAADVGIAVADKGATVASETASAVLTADDISRVADVVEVSRRTVSVAVQSIWAGIIVSVGLMLVAACGYLPAVAGALLQEVVDLVAIFSALRALGAHRWVERRRAASPGV